MHFIIIIIFLTLFLHLNPSHSNLLSQPLKPPDFPTPNTVPSFPVQPGQPCQLDLSAELFGGVKTACTHNLDRSRCCPVLAAWLYAAHARKALTPDPNNSSTSTTTASPMIPDDSQRCVSSLQVSLESRDIRIPQPNSSCDAIICFCGIRLHQIGSLSCPAAFNVTAAARNATPTAVVKNLEKNCRNSSFAGCTKCLDALHKLNGEGKNGTTTKTDRMSKMLNRDCQLMGLTWLLAKNKTAYIPTVSAILRAIMYNAHQPTHRDSFTCSPDQENMPLAVDSLQFDKSESTSSAAMSSCLSRVVVFVMTVLPLVVLLW